MLVYSCSCKTEVKKEKLLLFTLLLYIVLSYSAFEVVYNDEFPATLSSNCNEICFSGLDFQEQDRSKEN